MNYISERDLALARRKLGEDVVVPPKPKRRKNEESQIQCALVKWWALARKAHGLAETDLFSIPNGGWRGPVTGAIMHREGARAGACDLMLAVPTAKYAGLFLELKTPTGTLSAAQKEFIAERRKRGYMAGAAYGFDDAVRFITAYLRGEEFL